MVQKTALVSETFSELFQLLNENVREIKNNSGDTITLDETDSGNYWTGSFPNTEEIQSKDRYPIGILKTPEFDESVVGLRRTDSNLEVEVSVFDTRAEHPPKFVEKAVDCFRNSEDLKEANLYNVSVIDSTKTVLTTQRADLKIHEYTATMSLGFEFEVAA
jgi:hypothetical protein